MEEQMQLAPEVAVVHTDTSVTNTEQPTIEVLTAEIKMYLHIANQSVIEVGKRLIQAKELVAHGEWANWLKSNFNLGQRMANNFMAIAERFGKMSNNQNSQSIANLGTTQMIAMLSLPEGKEENFLALKAAEGTPAEDMTIKELRAEIKKYKEELEHTKSYLKGSEDSNKIMEDRFEYADSERVKYMNLAVDAEKRINGLLEQVSDLTEDKDSLTAQVNQMKEKLSQKKQIEVPPADYAELQREVKELRERPLEVATEFPADYAPLKAKVEQLENREENFKALYATAQQLGQLFNIITAISASDENLNSAITYLAEENVEKLEESLTTLGNLHAEMGKYLAIWKRANTPNNVQEKNESDSNLTSKSNFDIDTVTEEASTSAEMTVTQKDAWTKLAKMSVDKVGFSTVIKNLLKEIGGYEKVADVPDDKIAELMDKANNLYESFDGK